MLVIRSPCFVSGLTTLLKAPVLKALNNMEEDKGFYDDLYDAALVRQHEDYK